MTHGQSVVRRAISLLARLTGLLATLCALVATSPPESGCEESSPPVVFRAQGTCGAGGIVVVSTNNDRGTLSFDNVAALGILPNIEGVATLRTCPAAVEKGGWEWPRSGSSCPTDGGTWAECAMTCSVAAATVPGDSLQFVCVDAQKQPVCTSTLTVVQ